MTKTVNMELFQDPLTVLLFNKAKHHKFLSGTDCICEDGYFDNGVDAES